MKLQITNNRVPADNPYRSIVADLDHPTTARCVLAVTGGGMSGQDTARAMALDESLRQLPVGDSINRAMSWVDPSMNRLSFDLTFTKLED